MALRPAAFSDPAQPRSNTVNENQKLAEMAKQIAELTAQNASLKAASETSLSLKVSEKGAVSVYGMGRFPVTHYAEQWERLLAAGATIIGFIEVNRKAGRIVSKADRAAQDAKATELKPAAASVKPTTGKTSAL